MDKMRKFIGEVPRVFTTVEAPDETSAMDKLKEVMSEIVDGFATVEDITDKEIPTAKEAMTAKTKSLLGSFAQIMHLSSNLKNMTQKGFYGIGEADIVVGKDLMADFGETTGDGYKGYISFRDFFDTSVDAAVKESAAAYEGTAPTVAEGSSEDDA